MAIKVGAPVTSLRSFPPRPDVRQPRGLFSPSPIFSAGAHRHQQWGLLFVPVPSVSILEAFGPAMGKLPDPLGGVGLRLGARRFVTGLRRLTAVFAGCGNLNLISPVCQLVADATLSMNEQF